MAPQMKAKEFGDWLELGVRLLRTGKVGDGIAEVTIAVTRFTGAVFLVEALRLNDNAFGIHLHWAGAKEKIPHSLMMNCDRVDVYDGEPERVKDRYANLGKLRDLEPDPLERQMTRDEALHHVAEDEAGMMSMFNPVAKSNLEEARRVLDK